MVELERESAFYEKHKAEFHEKYLDKWLVITSDSLWGVYDTIAEAAKAALAQLEPGNFMLHRPMDDDRVLEVGPRIRFRYPDEDKKPKIKPKITVVDGNLKRFTYGHR